jgi:putative ABC transport system permease protein
MTAADFVLALRLIRKQPIHTLTAILALATGIGLATTGFTFLEAGLTAELPFRGGGEFVMVDVYVEPEARRSNVERDRFEMLRKAPGLKHLGAVANAPQNLLLPSGEVALAAGTAITPESFDVLPYAPILGRRFHAGDAVLGAAPVTLIRESLWRRHFSADPAAIGARVNMSGVSREVVGVMPDSLEFPNSPEVWVPLTDFANARVFGVLANRDGLALAQQQLDAWSKHYEQAQPGAPHLRLRVLPFIKALSEGLDILATAVVAVLLLVLIVIAANVGNLVLTRTMARSSELAVRSALGATRSRLVMQVFTEVLVLGLIAAALGLFASRLTFAWVELTMTDMPFWIDFTPGVWTTTFIAFSTVLAAAIGGAWPALAATRRDSIQALAASNRRVAGGLGFGSSVMIALQVSLSIAALYAALVVARGVSGYLAGASTPGEAQIVTARLYVPEDASGRHAQLLERVRRLPGVRHAALATSLPRLSPATRMASVRADHTSAAVAAMPAPRVAITPGFIEALGARPLAGRGFTDDDLRAGAPPVAIVNEPFAARFFGGQNPVGRQVRFVDPDAGDAAPVWHEIVGVVPDLGLSAGDEELAGGVYVPLRNESLMYVAVATSGDTGTVSRRLAAAIADVDPRLITRDIGLLADVGREDRAVFAAIGATLTSLGAIAVALALIGIYATLSFAVTARTREIAIRSALGASRRQILRSILGRAAAPLIVGIALGPLLGSALVAARGIFAFRLPADAGPWALPLLSAAIAVAALVAAYSPARRAVGIATADALRAD